MMHAMQENFQLNSNRMIYTDWGARMMTLQFAITKIATSLLA